MILIFMMSSFGSDSSNAQSHSLVQIISQVLPNSKTSDLTFLVRKTAHFTEYAILGILFFLSIKQFYRLKYARRKQNPCFSDSLSSSQHPDNPPRSNRHTHATHPPLRSSNCSHHTKSQVTAIFLAVFLSFLYACTDEFHQLFIIGRSGQFSDVLIDTFGAITGVVLIALVQQVFSKNRNDIVV